jgi:hypothetical protein
MTDPAATRSFLLAEVDALTAFDFLAVRPAATPLHGLEVARREDHRLEVRVPGRPPLLPVLPVPVRAALRERGFRSEDAADPTRPWVCEVADAQAAVDLLEGLLRDVFGEKPELRLDVAHGSHKAEHAAREKLAAVRGRIESLLKSVVTRRFEQDRDGDYVLPINDVHVVVAPRIAPDGPVIVRVFAITNVGVAVTPELGLFLARLNFGLMFGRFVLDAEHRSIWFDETLLGDQFSDEELRFTIDVVASTADQWDDRLKQMFGGVTHQEGLAQRSDRSEALNKPGQGLYV